MVETLWFGAAAIFKLIIFWISQVFDSKRGDSGIYTLTVKNSWGTDKGTAKVTVLGKIIHSHPQNSEKGCKTVDEEIESIEMNEV